MIMYTNVISFTKKLKLFSQQFQTKLLIHFPTLKQRENNLKNSDYKKYETITNDLFKEFSTRFKDFQKMSNDLSLVSLPFSFNVNNALASIRLELINLQSNFLLKNQFSEKTILEFYASLNPEIFKNISHSWNQLTFTKLHFR